MFFLPIVSFAKMVQVGSGKLRLCFPLAATVPRVRGNLIHFRTGGFDEAVYVLLFHIQMLQAVEASVTHGA